MRHNICLTVNGTQHELRVESRRTLLQVIREDLGLTGTKKGCEKGECGVCSVFMNGKVVNSCLVLGVEADGKDILTIEGLGGGQVLHPLQKTFVEHGAIQCGYCTPGMILAAKAILDENLHPTEDQIKKGIEGNLCRCTGYAKIIKAIMAVVKKGPSSSFLLL
ncbi:MAG: (2Fe-2S)-binding protein [Candidatus Hodarchaeota archaeon]